MKNNIPNSNKERLKIAESALFNGREKASSYFRVDISLIDKWIYSIDLIRMKAENETTKLNKRMKEKYDSSSKEIKKERNKHKTEKYKKYCKKHCFVNMIRNLKKNLKSKGFDYVGEIKPFDLWCLAKRQKLKCALSGIKLTVDNLSIDHIIPLSKGGSSELSNLQIVDKKVNLIKSTMLKDELLEFCKKILQFNGCAH